MRDKLIISFIILMLCISPVASAEWNAFGGDIYHSNFQKDTSDFVTNIWTFNMESPIFSTPAINNDSEMFVASNNGVLKCIAIEDGDEKWSIDLKNEITSSPIVDNDNVYISTHEKIYAINKNTHKISWSKDISGIESTPSVVDGKIYFGSNNGHVYGLNNETGDETLKVELKGEIKSSPLVVNNTIYIGSTDNKIYALDLNGNEKWTYTTGDSVISSPAYGDEKIIVGSDDGYLYVLNQSNGQLVFKSDLCNKVQGSATIDEHDNNIFIGSNDGNISCLDLRDGTVKWSRHVGGEIKSTPALSEKNLAFASTNGFGYVLNKYTGAEILSYNPGTMLFNSPITASPVIYGHSLLFSSQDGYVYSLNLEKHETPASIFLYITIILIIIVLVIVAIVIKKVKKRD